MKTRRAERLLELDDVERRLKPVRRRYLAVRAIPLEALVGTDGRANAFTRDFRPLHAFSRDRLRSLRRAFGEGGYPPIVAVKLGDAYSVIDGHHRAALARRSGAATIDADVTELLENIQVHGYHLMRGRGRVLANAEIASDWYDAIYAPTLAAIEQLGGPDGDMAPGELFLGLHRHRRDAFPSVGCPHLAQTVVSVIGSLA